MTAPRYFIGQKVKIVNVLGNFMQLNEIVVIESCATEYVLMICYNVVRANGIRQTVQESQIEPMLTGRK